MEISNVPKVAKVPHTDYAYAVHLTQQPKIDLFIYEIAEVRGLPSTPKLPERLEIHYTRGYHKQWPLERILDQYFTVLKAIFKKMSNAKGYTQTLRTVVMKKMEEISREWNTPSELPKRINLPYQSCKVHQNPDRLMEFRDSQDTKRFFRMKDHTPKADVDILRFMQMRLNPSDKEENMFRRQLQKFIDERTEKGGRKKNEESQ